MIDYAPGEILQKIAASANLGNVYPNELDVILYIEYIFSKISIREHQCIVINEGDIYISWAIEDDIRKIVIGDPDKDVLFYAKFVENKWVCSDFVSGEWMMLLEYAYDKVRHSMESVDRFITEFPPMGII